MSVLTPRIKDITPTPCLKGSEGALQQCVEVTFEHTGTSPVTAELLADMGREPILCLAAALPPGTSRYEGFIPAIAQPATITFVLRINGRAVQTLERAWIPPRRWTVHVVQASHHDYGYTDLPSRILRQHADFLDEALEYADATADFPEEARFRTVIEQGWSLDYFLRHRSEAARRRMMALLCAGDFEVTALFGNLTTEICDGEVLARAAYYAAAWKRDYGVPIVSAEHNDIPGVSWGLCTLLTDLGVKLFVPGIPMYWTWGQKDKLASCWDRTTIFGAEGLPGAFWWEAPTGKRVLFWCNGRGAGGDCHTNLPGLLPALQRLTEADSPYDVVRWRVTGAFRDNAPYRLEYAHHIKDWNAKWTWPRLIFSTNARFWSDLQVALPDNLPVWRGDMPGPDYPPAAACTAAATATDRGNHAALLSAEKLTTSVATRLGGRPQTAVMREAYEDTLFFDCHCWGYQFPAGPAAVAAHAEKVVHAYRAAALTHEVANKALARLADNVRTENADYHLVVFNPLAHSRTAMANAILRELDNCGSEIVPVPAEEDPEGVGYHRGMLLNDRMHAHLPMELVEGKFDLIDTSTQESTPFQIVEIDSPYAPAPYAAQRLALGSGTLRSGAFEHPLGIKRTLQFIAREVPACGYKTYRLKPRPDAPPPAPPVSADPLENDYYRIGVDAETGGVVSIYDKRRQSELLDAQAPYAFGQLLVRKADNPDCLAAARMKPTARRAGAASAAWEFTGSVHGHPIIVQSLTIYADEPRIHLAVSILKDALGLLDVHMALPFAVDYPRFRYAAPFAAVEPIKDFLPGAQAERLAVGPWVSVGNNDGTILCACLDSPIMSFARPWPAYTSPAHSCWFDPAATARHKTLTSDDLDQGHLYPLLFANNYGTNFYTTQPGDALFRFVLTSRPGTVSDAEAARFGAEACTPLEQIFTQDERPRKRKLPVSDSLLQVDNPAVQFVTLKPAEDGDGLILRLWNAAAEPQKVTITLPYVDIAGAELANLAEEAQGKPLPHTNHTASVELGAYAPGTIRIKLTANADDCGRSTNSQKPPEGDS